MSLMTIKFGIRLLSQLLYLWSLIDKLIYACLGNENATIVGEFLSSEGVQITHKKAFAGKK